MSPLKGQVESWSWVYFQVLDQFDSRRQSWVGHNYEDWRSVEGMGCFGRLGAESGWRRGDFASVVDAVDAKW
jgi:hypothetical protein